MSYTRAQVDAALQEKALRDHNAGVERARRAAYDDQHDTHGNAVAGCLCIHCGQKREIQRKSKAKRRRDAR